MSGEPRAEVAALTRSVRRYLERERAAGNAELIARVKATPAAKPARARAVLPAPSAANNEGNSTTKTNQIIVGVRFMRPFLVQGFSRIRPSPGAMTKALGDGDGSPPRPRLPLPVLFLPASAAVCKS